LSGCLYGPAAGALWHTGGYVNADQHSRSRHTNGNKRTTCDRNADAADASSANAYDIPTDYNPTPRGQTNAWHRRVTDDVT
jgi:hypothetical protein